MNLKMAHYLILKEVIISEKLSIYDISKNLIKDYGNTSRYTKQLLKWNLIQENDRIKSKTNSEKILYSPTRDGFVIYLRHYLSSNKLLEDNIPANKLQKHEEHIKKIFSKYPLFFPNISKNLIELFDLKLYTSCCLPYNHIMWGLAHGCKEYLNAREEHVKNPDLSALNFEMPLEISLNEKEISLMFEVPAKQDKADIFENGFIKQYILEPPIFIFQGLLNFPANLFFSFRLGEIYMKSENLKNLIQDYFVKKEIYHSDYEKYYKKLSEIEITPGE